MKRLVALFLVLLLSIESFASTVGDNDGAAFITKAEFDSLKHTFQTQIDRYYSSIDNKIDGAIASYIAGINLTTVFNQQIALGNDFDNIRFIYKDIYETGDLPFNGTYTISYSRGGTANNMLTGPAVSSTTSFQNKDQQTENGVLIGSNDHSNQIKNLRRVNKAYMDGSCNQTAIGPTNGYRNFTDMVVLPCWSVQVADAAAASYEGYIWDDLGFSSDDLKCGREINDLTWTNNVWSTVTSARWIGRGTKTSTGLREDIKKADVNLTYGGTTYVPNDYGMFGAVWAAYGHDVTNNKNTYGGNLAPIDANFFTSAFETKLNRKGPQDLLCGSNKYIPSEIIYVSDTHPLQPRIKFTSHQNETSSFLTFRNSGFLLKAETSTANGDGTYNLTNFSHTNFGTGIGTFDADWKYLISKNAKIYNKDTGVETGVIFSGGANYLVMDNYFFKPAAGTSVMPGEYCYFDKNSFNISGDSDFDSNCDAHDIYSGFPLTKLDRAGTCVLTLPIRREMTGGLTAPNLKIYITNGPIRKTDDLSLTSASGDKTVATNKYVLDGAAVDNGIIVSSDTDTLISFECSKNDIPYLHVVPQWSNSSDETKGRENCEVVIKKDDIKISVHSNSGNTPTPPSSSKLLYTIGIMSDEHLDRSDLARSKFGKVLETFNSRGVEEIISCGDHSMNGDTSGWVVWTQEIANSTYYSADEIHSCLGNHELYPGVSTGWQNFIQYDNDGKLIGQDKAYYSEEILGDKFIFMAIDKSSAIPDTHDCFTDEQITWATNEIESYSGTGNVWIVEHAYINDHGPGDSLTSPGYGHGLDVDGSYDGNNGFYNMLRMHPEVIFIHGHSHIRLQDRDSYGLCVFSTPTSSGKAYTGCYSLHVPSLNRQKYFTSPGTCVEDPCNDNSTYDRCEAWICKNYEDRIEFQGIKAYTNTDIPNMKYTIYK